MERWAKLRREQIVQGVPIKELVRRLKGDSYHLKDRLMDAQTGAPQREDETPDPAAVTAVSGPAHDRDDLVNLGGSAG